jgi:mono/diheme cytochrome c family protein
MKKSIRIQSALAAILIAAGASCFAQSSGEATYKAKCATCHGVAGMAESNMAHAMKVKPVSDPEVKKHSLAQMIEITKNGLGKMPAYKDKLTDAQIKDATEYFHKLVK